MTYTRHIIYAFPVPHATTTPMKPLLGRVPAIEKARHWCHSQMSSPIGPLPTSTETSQIGKKREIFAPRPRSSGGHDQRTCPTYRPSTLHPRPTPASRPAPRRSSPMRHSEKSYLVTKTKTCPVKHVVSNHRRTSQTARRRRPSPHLDPRLEGRSRARMPVPGGLPPSFLGRTTVAAQATSLQPPIAPVAHPKRPPRVVSYKNGRPSLVRFRF